MHEGKAHAQDAYEIAHSFLVASARKEDQLTPAFVTALSALGY